MIKEQEISSIANPLVKDYRKLLTSPKYRQRRGRLAIEGPNLVSEALRAGLKVDAILFTDSSRDYIGKLEPSMSGQSPAIYRLSDRLFKSITMTETPQTVGAIIEFCQQPASRSVCRCGFAVLLDGIQDPGNAGTIIRTAAAAGADLVICSPGTADPFGPKALRSSAGAAFHLDIIRPVNTADIVIELKKRGHQVVAADPRAALDYRSADYLFPLTLLIGSESSGLSASLAGIADIKVSIPLCSTVESLNVAVATGIILFQAAASKPSFCLKR